MLSTDWLATELESGSDWGSVLQLNS